MAKIVDLYIDGYIGQDSGFDAMFGGDTAFSLKKLNNFLQELESDVTDIHVHINSGGGSVDEGFAIYDKLSSIPYNVTTIAEGLVGSIATVIYLAGSTRKIFENSKFFIHNPYYQPNGGEAIESKDAARIAEDLKFEEERILNFYVEKTGKSAEELKPYMDKQTSFTSDDALSFGFVTEIVKKETKNLKEYQLVAYINQNKNNEKMDKKEQISWFEKIEKKINSILKAELKAEKATTAEGVEVWYDGALEVGTKIFIDEALTTPAPDGEHTIFEVVYVVANGEVESIKETETETEALQKENEGLKAEIENLKKEKGSLEAQVSETQKTINEFKVEIENFRKVVVGAAAPKPAAQNFKGNDKQTPHRLNGALKNLQNKYGKR